VAPFEVGNVDRDRGHRVEEVGDVALLEVMQMRSDLGRMLDRFGEKAGRRPGEQTAVPQRALLHETRRLHGVRFFLEPADQNRMVIEQVTGLDVAVAGFRTRRYDAHRDERVVALRGIRGARRGMPERGVVAHPPVRVHRDDGALALAIPDDVRRPRQRGRGGGGPRLGEDIRARHLGQERPRGSRELRRRHDEDALGGDEAAQPLHGLAEQWIGTRERKHLLRPGGGRQRPEARSRSAREYGGPPIHGRRNAAA
jgi:hypothetical protein